MASSSSSSRPSSSLSSMNNPRNNKYDVFLSFREEETRDSFNSHLYSALCETNIETFIDDQLVRGNEISQSLLDAIEASSISVIVFSEGYASSRWCLDELLKILDCRKEYAQIVIPVFYRVDPSHVRKQIGSFGVSISELEKRFPDKKQSWGSALTEAANLSGFDSHVFRNESELIKTVVDEILERLPKVVPFDNKNQLVGVESRVEELESLLAAAPILGIWGIGGIGKTTIARVIFNKISRNFEGSCFLQNVREESQSPGGLARLQQKLFNEVLKDVNVIPDIDFNFRRLSRRKVLIVLDDVTSFSQIKSFIRVSDWFLPESRLILTTRDQQVLKNWVVKERDIYEMKELEHDHALELFSRHAFKQNCPPEVGYKELSEVVINYAQGVPLALEILGCYLFGREKEVWESAINKLKRIPNVEIQNVLKVSFDDLDDEEKDIFLDIVCFFKGKDKDFIIKFLNACGFDAQIGISDLVNKSLIVIHDNKITMHDLLQEMGREIVRQESVKNPGERSRLWHHEDIIEVLTFNTGTKKVEGICFDMSRIKEIYLHPDTFTKMCKLRFLKFYNSKDDGENKCKVSYLVGPGFAEVRYLHWYGYPLKSLPSNIHPEKLVSIEMPHGNIQQLWDDVEHNGKLKQIISRACNFFTKSPNHSLTLHLDKLVNLNLNNCKSLRILPAGIFRLEFLKELDLWGCSKLKTLPEISSAGNIEVMYLNGTAIEELPSSIECLSRLSALYLDNCKRLKSLPSSLCKLNSLNFIYLRWCSSLKSLPDELGNLEALDSLIAEGTAIREVPLSIVGLNNFDGLQNLTSLYLTDCGITELPENLGQLSLLRELYLEKNNFERIPESIIHLSKLAYLKLSYCERLQSLPKLPCNLSELDAHHCTALESSPGLVFPSHDPQSFNLTNNLKLDRNEIWEILEDALQEIQVMAIARWKQLPEMVYFFQSSGR
ncbi:disease resistance-like protein DSC1 isoform X2 [Citrus clementina]|uniref:disease resistance-like protein DSC1 isoform X2 n=1 Tax=Citrus clementina TaxID=85681 RepID=UPI000CECEF0D|nr:disease resistance-like protein DSC1 isoform X2 [Citrus x clementina]